MLRIVEATYKETGRDSQRHETGLVEVRFSNCRVIEFEDVDANDFKTWRESNWSLKHVPFDMQPAFSRYWREFRRR
jgi:hypothetical protein